MPNMPADERRAKLLEAAQRVMAERGVAGGTTRAIVAEAGMSLATFHYCFHSREEMLRELIVKLSDRERHAAGGALSASEDPRESLRAVLYGYLAHLEENAGEELLLLELNHYAQRTPALRDLAAEQYLGYYAGVREILAGMSESSELNWRLDAELLARLAVTITDGITTTWLADRDSVRTREVVDAFVDLLAQLAEPARTAQD